ncbi:MAG: hypothetical protein WCI02_05175 [Planctomycetota bacterium]|jgi:hypothetical protein
MYRLQEAIQVAKEVGESLGTSQVLQREVQEGNFQTMILLFLDVS